MYQNEKQVLRCENSTHAVNGLIAFNYFLILATHDSFTYGDAIWYTFFFANLTFLR